MTEFDTLAAGPVIVIALVEAIRRAAPKVDGLYTVLVAGAVSLCVSLAATWYQGGPWLRAIPLGLLVAGLAIGGDAWASKVLGKAKTQ